MYLVRGGGIKGVRSGGCEPRIEVVVKLQTKTLGTGGVGLGCG